MIKKQRIVLLLFQQTLLFIAFLFTFIVNKTYAQENNKQIEELKQSILSKKDTAKVNALNKLALELKRIDPNQALLHAKEALSQSESIKYIEGEAFANKNIGTLYWITGNYEKALLPSQSALHLFSQLKNQLEIGNTYNLLGTIHWNKGDYVSAKKNYTQALTIFKTENDEDGVARTLSNFGNLYSNEGNLTKAIEYQLAAVKIAEKQTDKLFLASVVTNIGIIYTMQNKYDKAIEYSIKTKDIGLLIGDKLTVANSFSNIGTCYYYINKLDSALANHLQGLKYHQEIGNEKSMGESYNSIGGIYILMQKMDEALVNLEKALVIKKNIGDRSGQMSTYYNIGYLYQAQKQYNKAVFYLNESLAIAKEIHSKQYTSLINEALSETYLSLNDYKNAYQYYRDYSMYRDSVFNKESNDKLLALETQYETAQKEKEIELLNKDAEVKNTKLKLIYLGVIFLIIISLLIIILQVVKSKKNKKILEAEILIKEKELEFNKQQLNMYIKTLIEKQELLDELNLKYENLQQTYPKEFENIEEISQLISSKIITDEDWEAFKNLFEKVYQGFFFKLKNSYPDITTAELRLAALIKINLNSKEISSMIGISAESVKKNRQRLRKKMQLQAEDDLENHILKM